MARSENNLTAVLQDTADAIRAKKGTEALISPRDFADEVSSIPSGGVTPTGKITLFDDGVYDVTNYASAEVKYT